MDDKKRQRCVAIQKTKLLELINKHPELVLCKRTQASNHVDSQRTWKNIANELNSLPGARKSWRQWRKTWQDLRAHTKKLQREKNVEIPFSVLTFTSNGQEALGIAKMSAHCQNRQESTEFITVEQELMLTNSFEHDTEIVTNLSSPESPPDVKVFNSSNKVLEHKSDSQKMSSAKHSNTCAFNCDKIAAQEQKKIELKEDYLIFKKDYLRQKLKLMKEQTEALKCIAEELCNSK